METLFYTFSHVERCIIAVAGCILLGGIVIGCIMLNDYNKYLDEHFNADHSFLYFLRKESFYLFLYVAFVMIVSVNLLYALV